MSYADVARALPLPSDAQTREFAEYVTSAHSWYKHLPRHRSVPFVFFLDPNAGRTLVDTGNGLAFVDNTDEREAFHYTWQLTATYRERFGHWNYEQSYGRAFMYSTASGMANTDTPSLRVQASDGSWHAIPSPLAHAGTAEVSALMYGSHSRRRRSPEDEARARESSVRRVFRVETFPRRIHEAFEQGLEELLPLLPDDVASALGAVLRLRRDEDYRRALEAVRRPLDEIFRHGLATQEFDAKRAHSVEERATATWRQSEFSRREQALFPPLIAALDRERERQIGAMVNAMNRFAAALRDRA